MVCILLVDDEVTVLKNISRSLRRSGFDVVTAEDCAQARLAFSLRRFDLVCIDYFLPGRNGLELLEDFRQSVPDLPAIVISAAGGVETKMRACCLDGACFLPKPFSLADLREVVIGRLQID